MVQGAVRDACATLLGALRVPVLHCAEAFAPRGEWPVSASRNHLPEKTAERGSDPYFLCLRAQPFAIREQDSLPSAEVRL